MDVLDKFQKTHECPKCARSYFTLDISWMNTYVKTVYTCESCSWSCIVMSSCTSPSSVRDLSLKGQSVTSSQLTQ
jgi:hypothetical protein